MSQPAATALPRTDWSLIWAERGFRYFFFAMFISLFGSGMNFAGVSWHILALTHSTVKVSYQVIVATAPGLLIPFIGGVLIDRYDRGYLGVLFGFRAWSRRAGHGLCSMERPPGTLAFILHHFYHRNGFRNVLG